MKAIIILVVLIAIVIVGTVWSCCYVAGLSDKDKEDKWNDKQN